MRRSLSVSVARLLLQQQQSVVSCEAGAAATQWLHIAKHSRPYSQPASQAEADQQQQQQDEDTSERVKQLAADIMSLSVLECSQLSRVLRDKLGVPRGSGMAMMPMMAAGAPAAAAAAPAAADAPAEEKKEKTDFDVKLEGFSPEGKIKVIKEIRALTNLGLKEAKELVEKAPIVIKTSVAKGDAEAMKKQLEAVGGKVVLE